MTEREVPPSLTVEPALQALRLGARVRAPAVVVQGVAVAAAGLLVGKRRTQL